MLLLTKNNTIAIVDRSDEVKLQLVTDETPFLYYYICVTNSSFALVAQYVEDLFKQKVGVLEK